jgi:hypothetical protein
MKIQNKYYIFLYSVVIAIAFLVCMSIQNALAQDGETDQVLSAAESLFKAMKAKQYKDIWPLLTLKTQDNISDNVIKASSKEGHQLTKEQVKTDFSAGGPLAKAYWDAYMETFNPDMVLQQSTWKMGKIKKNEAEILIQYRKAEKPAIIQMNKENGTWKTGLEETFGVLKWILR